MMKKFLYIVRVFVSSLAMLGSSVMVILAVADSESLGFLLGFSIGFFLLLVLTSIIHWLLTLAVSVALPAYLSMPMGKRYVGEYLNLEWQKDLFVLACAFAMIGAIFAICVLKFDGQIDDVRAEMASLERRLSDEE